MRLNATIFHVLIDFKDKQNWYGIFKVLAFLFAPLAVYWSYKSLMPSYNRNMNKVSTAFSTDRAPVHVNNISKEPHSVGFDGHKRSRDHVIYELKRLGLETTLQDG